MSICIICNDVFIHQRINLSPQHHIYSVLALYRFRVSLYRFRVALYRFRVALYRFRVSLYRFRVALYRFRVALYRFRVALYRFRVALYRFRVALNRFRVALYRFRVSPGWGRLEVSGSGSATCGPDVSGGGCCSRALGLQPLVRFLRCHVGELVRFRLWLRFMWTWGGNNYKQPKNGSISLCVFLYDTLGLELTKEKITGKCSIYFPLPSSANEYNNRVYLNARGLEIVFSK